MSHCSPWLNRADLGMLAISTGSAEDWPRSEKCRTMPYLWMFFIMCMLGTLALCVMI